ncbi:succinate dehydrogenase iron-sulfur subunit [Candidatus Bipolaricaulota bacterium]|nr:succinate dehydrogenase iron-sulfur subunit [Candidatus Bipolaricaulota bacterium]
MEELVFRVNRYDPEAKEGSHYDIFEFESGDAELSDLTVLDCLVRIKEEFDGSLTFRHSCGHGTCGSCAVLINGENRLACETKISDFIGSEESAIEVSPLPGFPIIKDLVVDLEALYENDKKVKPYLIEGDSRPSDSERLQTPKELEEYNQATECIMCGACTSSCPTYWDKKSYLGPAAFVRGFRWNYDNRDQGQEERMEEMDDQAGGFWGCNKVFNCSEACPKDIDTVGAIDKLKRKALGF